MQNQSIIPTHVSLVHGQPMVSSLAVAEHFEKEHKHVMRDVRELGCSEEFARSNFGLGSYMDAQGQERPAVNLTKDGFVMLVMGYTGPKAMAFKEAYIGEFNRMDAELRRRDAELLEKLKHENGFNSFRVYCQAHEGFGMIHAAGLLDWMMQQTLGQNLGLRPKVSRMVREAGLF